MLRGYYTPNLKFPCFVCCLKIINTFEKLFMHLIANCPRNSQIASKFKQASVTLSKQSKYCFDQWLKNCLTSILVLFLSSLGQFTIRYNIIFQNDVDNSEIEHKTCYFLVRDAVLTFKVGSWVKSFLTSSFHAGNRFIKPWY